MYHLDKKSVELWKIQIKSKVNTMLINGAFPPSVSLSISVGFSISPVGVYSWTIISRIMQDVTNHSDSYSIGVKMQ